MTTEVSTIIQQTQEKLIKRLEKSGWSQRLGLFLRSEDFTRILEFLYTESTEGRHFGPSLQYLFRAFEECPFDSLKVVVIGQDPYFHLNVADGVAFSCSRTGKEQPSLRYIFNGIEEYLYDGKPMDRNPDLTRWCNQGVLMLNSAFTVQLEKPGSHYAIWRDFIIYLLDVLHTHKPNTPYILMGKVAATFDPYIKSGSPKIVTTHPAAAAYAKKNSWNGAEAFKKVNLLLEERGQQPITW